MASSYNPDRAEVYDDPADIKVRHEKLTTIAHATKFYVLKEDHTFGNVVRMELLRNPEVRFVGYRVAHPLEKEVQLTIQTNETVDAITALSGALNNLVQELRDIRYQFDEEKNRYRAQTDLRGGGVYGQEYQTPATSHPYTPY